MAKYRITTTGDGAGTWVFTGTWDDLVKEVARDMYHDHEVGPEDIKDVRGMLEQGHDGEEGWNGHSVMLRFEDGSLSVTMEADDD